MKSTKYLGIGLANMINSTNTEAAILSGPLIYEYQNYFEMVIGAAALILDNFF